MSVIFAPALLHAQDSGAPSSALGRAAAARIEPGDRVAVNVWQEPDLSTPAAIVNERSEILLPRLGTVLVQGLTPVSLRDTLRARYATFLRQPVVEVVVLRRVVVNGEVNRPGVYHVDMATALRDVIAQAGGITPLGAWNRVEIVRGQSRIPMRDWERNGSTSADLRSGDQVLVGRRSWFASNALGLLGTLAAVASVIIALR